MAARQWRRSHVIGKHEVGHADRDDPAMGRHPVLHRAHGMFADAVVNIAAAVVRRRERRERALVLVAPSRSGCARGSAPVSLPPECRRCRRTA